MGKVELDDEIKSKFQRIMYVFDEGQQVAYEHLSTNFWELLTSACEESYQSGYQDGLVAANRHSCDTCKYHDFDLDSAPCSICLGQDHWEKRLW